MSREKTKNEKTQAREKKRLQVFLAEAGVASRRGAEKLIVQGLISVNGRLVTELGTKVDPVSDIVVYKKRRVVGQKKALYAFYKPKNVVTTMNDPQGRPNVAHYFQDLLPERVFPVGRLDRDVTGLLLLTNDGPYAESLLHPRHGVLRTYLAVVEGVPDREILERMCKKVRLFDGGLVKAHSAKLRKFDSLTKRLFGLLSSTTHSVVEISVAEGRKHFVKKIFKAVGFPVQKLSRIAFGPYTLGGLRPGEIRSLSFQDLAPRKVAAASERKKARARSAS